jgi:hypothetical protein
VTGKEVIEDAVNRIMTALREGQFTRDDLEFLLKFFRKLVEITERMLKDSTPSPPAGTRR